MAEKETVSSRDIPDNHLELTGYGCSGCGWTLPIDIPFHEALKRFGQTHNSRLHFGQEAYLTRRYIPRITPIRPDKKPFNNEGTRYIKSFW